MSRAIPSIAASVVIAAGLAACGSAPAGRDSGNPAAHFDPAKDPYWQDPRWIKVLVYSVQAAVHDPADPADISTPGLHATVKFTYSDGAIEYPEIAAGTGDPELDKLLLHQVASVQVPRPSGLQTDRPHEFELDLDMPTPFEAFQSDVYAAIDAKKIYPKNAIISAATGNTTIDFDYVDGKADRMTMAVSSKSADLDKASMNAFSRAVFPIPPAVYAGKTMHMEVVFCYTLASAINGPAVTIKNPCPIASNVIVVQGTRIATRTIERTMSTY